MTTYPCPECGKGTVEKTVRKSFKTKVRGCPFVVPEAVIGVCNNCGSEFFGAKEVKRWGQLFDEFREARGVSLGPDEISRIRQGLRLTAGGFALFLGCTRQTVHNWERRDRKVPQLGMADLLLRLVDESCRHGKIDVVSWLRDRGQELGVDIEPAARRQNLVARSREAEVDFRPLEDYEKLFAASGPARDVPTLIQ